MNFCADSLTSKTPAFQAGDGGASPASALQFSEMQMDLCDRQEITNFVEHWHYSRSINGVKSSYCFRLTARGMIIGAMIFGNLAMHNQFKKYVTTEAEILELRRLCCIDATPKNTESFFLGLCLRWLKKNTTRTTILSYADMEHGHQGVIYKASNFKQVGTTPKQRIILWGDRRYHDHTIRTKYKGKLKPFAMRVKQALELGTAVYKMTAGKVIYIYKLR